MKKKIDLYALKLRSSSCEKERHKRKLSLVKHPQPYETQVVKRPSFIVATCQEEHPPIKKQLTTIVDKKMKGQ